MSKFYLNLLLLITFLIASPLRAEKVRVEDKPEAPLRSIPPTKNTSKFNWLSTIRPDAVSDKKRTPWLISDDPNDSDPIRFMLKSSKDEVALGEEFEVRIIAELLDIHPSSLFSFEGSNAYTLKVIFPEGFTQTGGDYTDFLTETLYKNNPSRQYVIRGKFERMPNHASFLLLRGAKGASNESTFILKKTLNVYVYNPEYIHKATRQQPEKPALALAEPTPSKDSTLALATTAACDASIGVIREKIFCDGTTTIPAQLKAMNCASNIVWQTTLFEFDGTNVTTSTGNETLNVSQPAVVTLKCKSICGTDYVSNQVIVVSNQIRRGDVDLPLLPSCSSDNIVAIFSAQTCPNQLAKFAEQLGPGQRTTPVIAANIRIPADVSKTRMFVGECVDICGHPHGNMFSYNIPDIPTTKDFVVRVTSNSYQDPLLAQVKSGSFTQMSSYTGNSELSVYADGCLGGKIYIDGVEAAYKDESLEAKFGKSYYKTDFLRNRKYVPSKQYIEVKCINSCGESTAKVYLGNQSASGFKLFNEKNQVCLGDSAAISAVGCPTGSLQWSSNVTVRSNPAVVKPTTATWYSARCTINGTVYKDSVRIETLALPTGTTAIQVKNLATNAIATTTGQPVLSFDFNYGNSIQLTATTGCAAGNTIAWYNNQTGKLSQTGTSITVQPTAVTQYWARCVNQTGCEGPISTRIETQPKVATFEAFVNNGKIPVVACTGSPASLKATGCDGTIKWYVDDLDGNRLNDVYVDSSKNGTLLTLNRNASAQYYGVCTFAGKEVSVSNLVEVIVPNVSVAVDAGSKAIICQNIPITLVAKGCHASANVSWFRKEGSSSVAITEGSVRSGENSFLNVSPLTTTLYFARCQLGSCTAESTPLEVAVIAPTTAQAKVRIGQKEADVTKEIPVCIGKEFELYVASQGPNDRGYVWQAPNGGKTFGDPASKTTGLSVKLSMEAAYAGRWTLLIYDNCSTNPVQRTVDIKGTKQIFITAFSYSRPDPLNNRKIKFKNNSYLVTNNGPVTSGLTYNWNFGDVPVGTSIERDPEYTYSQAKAYPVSLTVTNTEDQCEAVLTNQPITLGCQRPDAPVITYTGGSNSSELTICNNQPLTLSASGCGQNALWFVNNQPTRIHEGVGLQITPQLFKQSGTYQLIAQCKSSTGPDSCLGDFSKPFTLTITTPPTPVVKIKNNATGEFINDLSTYTPGQVLTVTAQGCDGFGTIRWEVKKNNESLSVPQSTAFTFPLVGLTTTQGQVYQFTAYCQQSSNTTTCESNRSNQPQLTVGVCPAVTVTASKTINNGTVTICGGTELKLTATGGNGIYEWYKDNLQVGTGSLLIPSTSGIYKAVSCQGSQVSATVNVQIIAVEAAIKTPSGSFLSDTTVKVGSSLILNGSDLMPPTGQSYVYSYQWTGPVTANTALLAINMIRADQAGTYKVTVNKTLNNVTCPASTAVQVFVQPASCNLKTIQPLITCGTGGATLKVRYTGANSGLNRQFSLDGITYKADSVFTNLRDTTYTIYLRERVGDQSQVCQAAPKTVEVFCDTTAACEMYILARDENGKKTDVLSRNAKNELSSLSLSVQTYTKKALGAGTIYEWTGPNNFTSKAPTIIGQSIGTYYVKVKRGNIVCTDSIKLTARPCGLSIPVSSCGSNGNFTAVPDEPSNRLTTLVEGDIIQAGDFEITITDVISGSAQGWYAFGKTEIPYMNRNIKVELKNAIINSCYQLTMGNATAIVPTVLSIYDNGYNGSLDLDNVTPVINNFVGTIEDLINNFSGNQRNIQTIQSLKNSFVDLKTSVQNADDLSSSEKQELLNKVVDLENKSQQIINNPCICSCQQGSAQGRVKTASSAAGTSNLLESCPLSSMKNTVIEINNKINSNKSCKETNYHKTGSTLESEGDVANGAWWGLYKWAHHVIEEEYLQFYTSVGQQPSAEYSIPESSGNSIGGTKKNTGYADIVNRSTGEIFEIKFNSDAGKLNGKREVENYVLMANLYCLSNTPLGKWIPGTNWFARGIGEGQAKEVYCYPCKGKNQKLRYWLNQPGVVLYQFIDNSYPALDPINIPVFVKTNLGDDVLNRLKKIALEVRQMPLEQWVLAPTILTVEVDKIVAKNLNGLSKEALLTLIAVGAIGEISAALEIAGSGGSSVAFSLAQATISAAIIIYAYEQI